jgi:hypothetical protein
MENKQWEVILLEELIYGINNMFMVQKGKKTRSKRQLLRFVPLCFSLWLWLNGVFPSGAILAVGFVWSKLVPWIATRAILWLITLCSAGIDICYRIGQEARTKREQCIQH